MKIFLELIFSLNNAIKSVDNNEQLKFYKAIHKNFIIANDISFMKHLPEFKDDFILINEQKVKAGQIIKRPLNYTGLSKLEYHYGIVLGTSINNESVIIEMTNNRNISLNNLKGFLAKYELKDIKIETPQPLLSRETIIERAKSIRYEIYSLINLNCKDFAYYCAAKIPFPKRKKYINNIQDIISDYELPYRKLQLIDTNSTELRKILEKEIKIREDNKYKTTKNSQGTFKYTKNNTISEFYCERCNRTKKSKIIVEWIDNNDNKKIICNACYGSLLSKD